MVLIDLLLFLLDKGSLFLDDIMGKCPYLGYDKFKDFNIIICFAVLVAFRWLFKTWLMKRIGGFTGDCLGAAQQISELLIYLVIYSQLSTEPSLALGANL